jgi:glycosyltransferase involved in cell wall biosynthesis
MRVLFVCFSERDPRVRKELQHLRARGLRDVGVMQLYQHNDANIVCWHDGFVDGYPVFRVNSRAASHAREAAIAMKPDVVHVHELDSLWAMLSVWEDDNIQAVDGGADAADSGVRIEALPMRMIYEAHEWERGRNGASAERVKRSDLCAGFANEVIVVSPAIAIEFENTFGRRPRVIPNSFRKRARVGAGRIVRTLEPGPGEHVIAFCGNVTHGRGLDVLAEAMRQLGRGYRLVILGDVREQDVLDDLMRGNDAHVMGRAPYPYPHEKDSLVEWLGGISAGVNLVDMRIPSYRMALPNKFFEYGFAGVPVVSNGQADVVRLTTEYNLGCIANVTGIPTDVEVDAPRLACAIKEAVWCTPRTDAFVRDWCWEATGAVVMDEFYGTAS